MVIINKPTAKRFRQEKTSKPFVKVLSIAIALVIAVSVFAVAVPMVTAKGESAFENNECIYIDMRNFTGWTDGSAAFRVFTFYNNSDDANYCHEYAGNFDNDGWYTGSNVLQAGIKADKFCDNVYRFRIPTTNISHLRIVRTNSSSSEKWNMSQMMWDNQRTKTAGSKSNCIKISSWDNSGTWSTFTPTANAAFNEKTAAPDSTITGNSNLFVVDATFYDYYTDDEIQKGWRSINYETNHASEHWTSNYPQNSWYWWAGYWEPYQYLNSKIAAQAGNDVTYPMYFGNFNGKNDNYTGEGSSNLKRFSNWVNNSANLSSYNKSVAGLTGGTLDADNDLVYATNSGYNSSTKVPFFDKSFLTTNKVGSVVNTKFPMRKEVVSGVTGYYFDSTAAKDNVWFNYLETDSPTISYGAGTSKGAKDSLYSYSDRQSSGYGFFPFDSSRGANVEANNFGFGMRTDIQFNIGMNGKNNNVEEVFEFTGDDDLWVYIDGNLVLDLGGDHKKAHGKINFANKTVTVDTRYETLNGATRNQSFDINNTDPTVKHTLTMFYVERGMVESNLSFNFNFAPVGNELIVDKTVKTADVNDSATFKAAVAAADTFSFNQPTANGKVSSKGTISNSNYTLKNAESISFKDQFAVPTDMKVTETVPDNDSLTYTTSWKAVDLVLKDAGESEPRYTIAQSPAGQDSKEANFTYKTKDSDNEFAMTRVQLSYVNTPAVAPVYITKTVSGLDLGETDSTDFNGTFYVDLGDGNGWKTYDLKYQIQGNSTVYTMTSGKLANNAQLRNGRTLVVGGIPQGAKVRFDEDAAATGSEYELEGVTGNDGTVGSSGASINITNRKLKPDEVSVTLTAHKTLQNANLTDGAFEFQLLDSNYDVLETKTCAADGSVTFSTRTYSAAATEEFHIWEKWPNTEDSDIQSYDDTVYDVEVKVTKSGNVLTPTVTYKRGSSTVLAAEFTNVVKKGEVYVLKTDNTEANVSGVQFAIYKVSREGESLDGKVALKTARTEEMDVTYSDGSVKRKAAVHFDNLPLYSDGKYYADSSQKSYQWYAVAETDPTTGYHKNPTVHYFRIPDNGSYAPKFDYVNGHILSPESGLDGMFGYKMAGIYAIALASLLGAAYLLYTKRNTKKARHRVKK